MGAIRKAFCFLFALSLAGGGLYLIIRVFIAETYPDRSELADYVWAAATTGGMMMVLGFYRLWIDFIMRYARRQKPSG